MVSALTVERFCLLAVLAFAGCKTPGGEKGNKVESTEDDPDCASIPVPSDPLLAGASEKSRAEIQKRAEDGVVAVEYVAEGCGVRMRVLSDCRTDGTYTYRALGRRDHRVIGGMRKLLEELPLASGDLAKKLKERGALRVDQLRVGRLEAPKKSLGDGLRGEACRGATHLIATIDVGGAAISAGPKSALQSESGYFDHDVPSDRIEILERVGDAKACANASKRGVRTDGCDHALRIDLVPVSAPARDPGAAKVVDRGEGKSAAGGMIEIAAGDLWMGNDAEKTEAPRHKVQLDGFSIDRLEVTAAQYDACVKAGACTAAKTGDACTSGVGDKSRHPINCVTWAQAKAYCEHKQARLPTEAEWERAARGADGIPFVWGNDWPPPDGAANLADESARELHPFWVVIPKYDDGFALTAPVGSFPRGASPAGAMDMAGNVMEWTGDWYGPHQKGTVKNPKGAPSGEGRVVRGGSFGHHRALHVSASARAAYREDAASEHIGFRCAK